MLLLLNKKNLDTNESFNQEDGIALTQSDEEDVISNLPLDLDEEGLSLQRDKQPKVNRYSIV